MMQSQFYLKMVVDFEGMAQILNNLEDFDHTSISQGSVRLSSTPVVPLQK